MFRRQVAIASIVLVISATAFALTKNTPELSTSTAEGLSSPSISSLAPDTNVSSVKEPGSKAQDIKSAEWLARQNSAYFTVQIFADTDDYVLPALTRQWTPDQPLARYQIRHQGEVWHFLTYGIFPSANLARRAAAKLPQSIQLFSPRVQPLYQVLARLHGVASLSVDHAVELDDANTVYGENIQKPGYAISVYSAETVGELRLFAREHGLDDVYLARAKDSADSWVTLLKGHYPTAEKAQADLDGLPDTVREFAWVKKMGSPDLVVMSLEEDADAGASKQLAGAREADAKWLAKQSRGNLTLLLATGADQNRLRKVGGRLGLARQAHLIAYQDGDAERFVLAAGGYADYAMAQKALDQISRRVSSSPVIVTFGVLKDAAGGDNESVTFLRGHELAKTRVAKSETDSR